MAGMADNQREFSKPLKGKEYSKKPDRKKIRRTYAAPMIRGSQKCFKDTNYLKFVMTRDCRLLKHIKIKYIESYTYY